MEGRRSSRRIACLTALAAALMAVALPQAAEALPQAAGAQPAGFSFTPSTSEPYAACGRPTPGHSECLAVLVPSAPSVSLSGSPQLAGPLGVGRPDSGGGVGGGYDPTDLRSAYNLPSASAGSGQTVAIVDAFDDPDAESDLATYRSRYGLSACTTANGCFRKVNETGGTSLPEANAGWAVEISLDVDMVSAACSNCHILLVEAKNNENANLFASEDEAVALGATEVTNSWAGKEGSGETSEDPFFDHPGVPITASAGDGGFGVEYPAASQYVIAVGGTALTQASNARGWTETAWSGTGSGCSAFEPKPSWQTDGGCAKRTNVDVSAVAAPETPLSVADSYKLPSEFSKPEPGWTLVGGTSASSPLVAGMMALSNAYTRSFPAAEPLYKEASQNGTGVLDDVTSGNNVKKGEANCGTYLCNAAPGYDGPTGLGSPYGAPVVLPNPPIVITKPASAITQTSATLNATVNPNSGEVSECDFEYGTSVSYGSTAPCSSLPGSGSSPVSVSAALTGLQANTTYHFRISAKNTGGTSKGSDETFITLPAAPAVATGAASSIAQTSATLGGTVNPNGEEVSKCEFEYGTTAEYGSRVACSTLPGSGSSPVAVSASLPGLAANTTYHFRLSATNPSGTTKGNDEAFKTLVNVPSVETKPASSVTQASATLNATVNPNGGEVTKCEFEYGTTVSYGKTAVCVPSTVSGSSPVAVSASVTGLTPGTTYHFRVVAVNAGGKGEGGDAMFQTSPAFSAPTTVTGTGSSLTASVASVTATVNPNNGPVTECEFEYGSTVSYGSVVPCRPTPGSGASAVAVSAPIGGLKAGTTYHFRVSATNSAGNGAGADQTFATPATVDVHWYKSSNRLAEGRKVPFISWGTLSLSSSKGGASTECQVAATGYIENPGGTSEGAFEMEGAETTQAFSAYDCANSECEADGGTAGLAGEGLPWSGGLSEEVKGTFRLPSAGVQLYVHCRRASSPSTEKPGTGSLAGYEERTSSEYNAPGAAACTTNGGGSMAPKALNGSSIEKPSKLQFSGGAGGELECGTAGKLTIAGSLKIQGFIESELVTAKDP